MGFPYQILGYFECRGAKNLIFGVKNQVFGGRRVRGALLGVLKGLKIGSILSTKSGRFCVCCVNTHIYTFATFCARTKSAKSENVQSVHAKFKVLRY